MLWKSMVANVNKAHIGILTGLVLGLLACNKPISEQAFQQPTFEPIYLELKPTTAHKVDSVLAGRRVGNAILNQTALDSTGQGIDLLILSLKIQHSNDTHVSGLDAKSNRLLRLKQGTVPVTFDAELPFYKNEHSDTLYYPHINSDYIDFYMDVAGRIVRVRDWDRETRNK